MVGILEVQQRYSMAIGKYLRLWVERGLGRRLEDVTDVHVSTETIPGPDIGDYCTHIVTGYQVWTLIFADGYEASQRISKDDVLAAVQ